MDKLTLRLDISEADETGIKTTAILTSSIH